MPYVIKTYPIPNTAPGQVLSFEERPYYGGNAIAEGDEAFIWYSNDRNLNLSGLTWSAVVRSVEQARHSGAINVTVRLIAAAAPNALSNHHLSPYRDNYDGGARSELARKLYTHAHNKVAGVSESAAALLRAAFPQT